MKDAFRRTDEMTHIIVNVKSDKVGIPKVRSGSRPFRAESGKVHVKGTEYGGNTRYEGWETSHGACPATALTDSPVPKPNH